MSYGEKSEAFIQKAWMDGMDHDRRRQWFYTGDNLGNKVLVLRQWPEAAIPYLIGPTWEAHLHLYAHDRIS